VIEHADRVTVMRRGRVVGTVAAAETDERELARMMVGREPADPTGAPRGRPGDVTLRAIHVGERDGVSPRRLHDVSFEVRSGEIVAIAGVEGNGQRELGEILAGLRPFRGEIALDGRLTDGLGAREVRRLGFAHVPEDRLEAGIVPDMTIGENLILGREDQRRFGRPWAFDRRAIRRHVEERIATFDIRPPRADEKLSSLSGGNQQKVVIAREAEGRPVLMLAAHPTRGVDVGAAEAIHAALLRFRRQGVAILLVTADLSEAMRVADRVLVLYSGRINGEFARGTVDEEELGARMIGATARPAEGGA